MVYLLMTVWFPPHKGEEVGRKAVEIMKKFPEDQSIAKTIVNGALMRTKHGIKAIVISEVKAGKLEAAFEQAGEILQLYSEIEGVNSRLDTMATLVESLSTVGLKPLE